MEITIKRYSRKLTYEDAATLDEFWELAKRTERSLDREQRRHWDGRECDEYIIAAQGLLPYCATPEELVCQQETLDEILARPNFFHPFTPWNQAIHLLQKFFLLCPRLRQFVHQARQTYLFIHVPILPHFYPMHICFVRCCHYAFGLFSQVS